MASNSLPLVSIITPSYNQAAYLENTIQSVLAQDYPNIEYIVVDGASTDSSPEIIKRYSSQLAYWVSEKDLGQADAINKGIEKAHGKYITWLNSDDIYLPGAVSQAVHHLQKNPSLGFVYGDAISIDVDGRPLNRLSFAEWGLEELVRFRIICQPAVFMRRDILEQAGRLELGYHFLLDHQLWIKLASLAPIHHEPDMWAAARHHPEAKNVSQAAAFGDEAMLILDWMKNDPALNKLILTNEAHILAGAYRLQARYLLDGGQPAASLRSYLKAFRYWPSFTLQHSHRIVYAIASLLKLQHIVAWLQAKKSEKPRKQLTKQLRETILSQKSLPGQTDIGFAWPGLNLDLY